LRRIGENVRFYRNLRGLTQTALARKVQVAPAYISQIEANQRVPSLKVTRRIAEVLDLDLSVLVRETDPRVAQGRLTNSEKLDLLRTLMMSIESSSERDEDARPSFRGRELDATELYSEPAYSVLTRVFFRDALFGRESADVSVECHVVLEGRVWSVPSGRTEEPILSPSVALDPSSSTRLRADAGARVLSVYAPRIELALISGPAPSPKREPLSS
jgi:transcriptional regulator with XRE-family HTH domain